MDKDYDKRFESIKLNQVWKLVNLLKEHKVIRNKWVLKIKWKTDESIKNHEAWLVAKGYTQQEGIDYEETFLYVVRFASIRFILAIIAIPDLELHQINVKTAFLNEELDEKNLYKITYMFRQGRPRTQIV